MLAGLQSSQTWGELEDAFQDGSLTLQVKWCWFLAGGVLSSPQGYLNSFTTWRLASPQSKRSKREQDGSHHVLYDLASEVTHHHFHSINVILVTWVSSIQCGRGHMSSWIPGDENLWAPSWRLATATTHLRFPLTSARISICSLIGEVTQTFIPEKSEYTVVQPPLFAAVFH